MVHAVHFVVKRAVRVIDGARLVAEVEHILCCDVLLAAVIAWACERGAVLRVKKTELGGPAARSGG